MRGDKITFRTPVWRQYGRVIGGETVTGTEIGFGLVAHPSLCRTGAKWGRWAVSDPETGGLIAEGEAPGRSAAIAALVQRIVELNASRRGVFRLLLATGRRAAADDDKILTPGGRVEV